MIPARLRFGGIETRWLEPPWLEVEIFFSRETNGGSGETRVGGERREFTRNLSVGLGHVGLVVGLRGIGDLAGFFRETPSVLLGGNLNLITRKSWL